VAIRGRERETVTFGFHFSDMPRASFECFALSFGLVLFSVIDQIFFETTKKLVNSVIMSKKVG